MPAKKTKTTKKAPAKKAPAPVKFYTPAKPYTHVVAGFPVIMETFFVMDNEPSCPHDPPPGAKFCPECGMAVVRVNEPTPKDITRNLYGPSITFKGFVTSLTVPTLNDANLRVIDLSSKGDQSVLILGRYLHLDGAEVSISLPGPHVKQVLLATKENASALGAFHEPRIVIVTLPRSVPG